MAEDVRIDFYSVRRCGYYKRGESTPQFGGLDEVLLELRDWAFDGRKPLSETCTYEIAEGDSFLHTYCFDSKVAKNKDVFLVTWNETETLEGAMATVNGTDLAGQAKVRSTSVLPGHIPGYPTYFWFIPSSNAFATLRFSKQRANGHSALKRLISEFLAKCGSHAVYAKPNAESEIEIIGYRKGPKDKVIDVHPHFESKQKRFPGKLEYLRKNRSKVLKVIRKSTLTSESPDDRSLWQKLLGNMGVVTEAGLKGELKVKSELPFIPSEQQMEEMIAQWDEDSGSKWIDVGFKLRGEKDIKWLSHTAVKTIVSLDVVRDASGVISTSSIESAISGHRARLLKLLGSSDEG